MDKFFEKLIKENTFYLSNEKDLEWKEQNYLYENKLNHDEATEVFGDKVVIEICEGKEREITKRLHEMKEREEDLYKQSAWCEDKNQWIADMNLEYHKEKMEKVKVELRKWQYKKRMLLGQEDTSENINVEMLKDIPIEKVFAHYGLEVERRGIDRVFYKLRKNEKTASACAFLGTNTFYDFGASVGGDNIILVQYVEKCDFIKACKVLKLL